MTTADKQPLRIVGLHASNFKKIVAVDIVLTGDEDLVTVGGQNEAGKSTVLDVISTVLGGLRMAPKVPIRKGQSSSTLVADLGDVKATRTFRRDDDGVVVSTLEFTNADGSANYKSPQSLADRLLGGAPFSDPLRFDRLKPSDRRAEVAAIVGLDFTELDARRGAAVARRTEAQRAAKVARADLLDLGDPVEAPEHEVDVAEALAAIDLETAALRAVDAAEDNAKQKQRMVMGTQKQLNEAQEARDAVAKQVEALQKKLAEYDDRLLPSLSEALNLVMTVEQRAHEALKAALDRVPNADPAREAIKTANEVNARVRKNQAIASKRDKLGNVLADEAAADQDVKSIDQEKQDALAAAPFPVPGMAFADDDVTIDGLPYEQASKAQRIRASVAMSLHRAGDLKVLLVKDGNDLDNKNLRLLAEVAREHKAQVWVERVTDDPASVTVFMEDGGVRRA